MKLIEALPDTKRIVSYSPDLVKITGDLSSAVLLAQMIFWTGKGKDQAWFYKSAAELQDETGLTYRQQGLAREKLRYLGLIKEMHARRLHRIYFFVDLEAVQKKPTTHRQVPVDKVSAGTGHKVGSNTEKTHKQTSGGLEEEERDECSSAEAASAHSPPLYFSPENLTEHLIKDMEHTVRLVAGKLVGLDCFAQLSIDKKETARRIRSQLIKLFVFGDTAQSRKLLSADYSVIKEQAGYTLQNICDCIRDHKREIQSPIGYLHRAVERNRKELMLVVAGSGKGEQPKKEAE